VIQAEKSAPAEIALLLRERQRRARDRVPLSQSPLVGLSGRRTVWQGAPARGKVLDDEGRKPSDVQRRRTYEFCSIGDSRASHVVEKSHDNSPVGQVVSQTGSSGQDGESKNAENDVDSQARRTAFYSAASGSS
jgi:hypothetical protein